jgi:4'-phosphopantetheinyl transferase
MSASSPVDVHIWFQETEYLDPEALALADQVLSPEERRQRDRFRFPEDRRDYAAAHSLLRRSLSRHAASRHPASRHPSDWHFEKNAFGKPYLSGGTDEEIALEFSLSHTRGFVACAIAPARVGIDVERARQNVDYEEIAQSNFSRREIEALEQLPGEARSVRVLELWTLKEAFLKAIGRGLSVELDSVVFELSPSGAIRLHAGGDVDANSWKFALFVPRPEVRMAVAVESPGSPRLFLQDRDVAEFRSDSGSALAQPWRGF